MKGSRMSSKRHHYESKWDTPRITSASPSRTWPDMALFLPNHRFRVEVMSWLSALKAITLDFSLKAAGQFSDDIASMLQRTHTKTLFKQGSLLSNDEPAEAGAF